MLLPAGTASASGLPAAQTRVGAIGPTVTTVVGVAERIAAGQRRVRAPSQLQFVSGHCVAAEDATALSRVDRVGSALSKDDPFHRSVSWVVDNPDAQRFAITGGDGVARELYQLPGELNGKSGVFEWILDESGSNPVINHQRFIPGGGVTGYPNQVP